MNTFIHEGRKWTDT